MAKFLINQKSKKKLINWKIVPTSYHNEGQCSADKIDIFIFSVWAGIKDKKKEFDILKLFSCSEIWS